MKLLSIDPATTTGWCVLEFSPPGTLDDEEGSGMVCIQDYGYFTIDTSSEYEGDHCKNMQNRILDLIDKWNIDEVCLEDYFFSRKARQGANKNVYFRGSIITLLRDTTLMKNIKDEKMHYGIVNIYNWKKYMNGKSTVSKELKKKYKANANKMVTVISLWEKHNIKFPNSFLSEKGKNKMVNMKMDVVDSIAIGLYYIFDKYNTEVPVFDCTDYYKKYNNDKNKLIYELYS